MTSSASEVPRFLLGLHSKAKLGLLEYLEEERAAETRNVSTFELELSMAEHLFDAAQEAFVLFQWRDTQLHRVLAALLCTCTKCFGSAISLCLRGNPAEAMAIMRSALEAAATATRVREHPELAPLFVDYDTMPLRQFRKRFGSDSDLMAQPLMTTAAQTYKAYSTFGTHPRFIRALDAITFDAPGGWRLFHARVDDYYCRLQLIGILLTMRDVLDQPIKQGFFEPPYPDSIERPLAAFETARAGLGRSLPLFMAWMRDKPNVDWSRRSPSLVLSTLQPTIRTRSER